MDAFDGIRRSAARLHDELVAAGADPLNPMSLVDAAIAKLGLELYWLEPGDPMLKGAHALYDEQSSMVCCEAAGNPGERALLVSHEIGHASEHAGSSSCNASDIDASRSTEAAPVGIQRVEDYGVRERRELQANVFAREFVLPRSLAVHLYVDEGMGASAIADRMGLPKNLVRQQLFDAPPSSSCAGYRDRGPSARPAHRVRIPLRTGLPSTAARHFNSRPVLGLVRPGRWSRPCCPSSRKVCIPRLS